MRTRQIASRLSQAAQTASNRKIRRAVTTKNGDHFRHLQIESGKVTSTTSIREKSQLEQYFPNIRPSVLPYYVGTDICHVPRIDKILYLDRLKGKKFTKPDVNYRFLERLFNEYELHYIHRTRLLGLTESQKQHFTNFVAGRWAAKEAIIKSAPPGRRLTLQDVMIITFSKIEADKPRGVILTTKCAKEFEATRQRNRASLAEMASSTPGENGEKLNSHHASKDLVEADRKTQIGTHDIEGQEVRLSISHDGVYATAVAISQVDDLGPIPIKQEDDGSATSRKAGFEMDDDVAQLAKPPRGFDRHNVDKRAFKRLDLRERGEMSQTADTLSGATHDIGQQTFKRIDLNKEGVNDQTAETSLQDVPRSIS